MRATKFTDAQKALLIKQPSLPGAPTSKARGERRRGSAEQFKQAGLLGKGVGSKAKLEFNARQGAGRTRTHTLQHALRSGWARRVEGKPECSEERHVHARGD